MTNPTWKIGDVAYLPVRIAEVEDKDGEVGCQDDDNALFFVPARLLVPAVKEDGEEITSERIFWAHCSKLNPRKYLNAPHVGVRVFYSQEEASDYFKSPDFVVVPVRLVLAVPEVTDGR